MIESIGYLVGVFVFVALAYNYMDKELEKRDSTILKLQKDLQSLKDDLGD